MTEIDIVSFCLENPHSFSASEKMDRHLQDLMNGGKKLDGDQIAALENWQRKVGLNIEGGLKLAIQGNQIQNIQVLNHFRRGLKTIPILEIALTFDPDPAFEKIVITELEKLISGPFLAKFNTNRELIAGCTISFQGKFKDYSLKARLTAGNGQVFKEVLAEIH